MNNPFDYTPDSDCEEAFGRLLERIATLKRSGRPADIAFCRHLEEGKMLGVLVAEDSAGHRQTLYAFSGQAGEAGFYFPGFVGPVFDYLRPDGYFKTKEAAISLQNREIELFEHEILVVAEEAWRSTRARLEGDIEKYKEACRLSKAARQARRDSGEADDLELAAMIRQSQFEKAELRRMRRKAEVELAPIAKALGEARDRLEAMKGKRRNESEALQTWLFSNFKIRDSWGESVSLLEIFASTPLRVPPSGAGECCAPKLLHAAFSRGWRPVAIAEYWYGRPKGGEVRIHGRHYPACRGKCLPILRHMLRGLDVEPPLDSETVMGSDVPPRVLYENEWFCVVDKPSGLLSVPGKGRAMSVQRWCEEKYGADRQVRVAHRLDQDTSGLLVVAFGMESYKTLQALFATRRVTKTYEAELDAGFLPDGVPPMGRMSLPLSPDWLDRPRQKVDEEGGKEAVTDYEIINVRAGHARVRFHPLTGRTHQLRVHSASPQGLGVPIRGDRLYGRSSGEESVRLHLHACRLEFVWPMDGLRYCFESPVPF